MKMGWSKTTIITVAITVTITAILFVVYVHNNSHHSATTYINPTCCGTSAETRDKGGHFEPMLRSWTPDECYADDPVTEYSPFDDRAWFYDIKFTRQIVGSDLDVLRNGDDIMAHTKYFHNEHYLWRKLFLAVARRLPLVDSKTMSLHHTMHCSQRIARFFGKYTLMCGMTLTLGLHH